MRVRMPLVVLAFVSIAFAGCVSNEETSPPETEEAPTFDYSDDRIHIRSINATAKEWVPTLTEPPQLAVGEYWKIHLTAALGGADVTGFIVVAGQEDDFWLLGMPTHDFWNDLMVMHLPGLGQVKKDTLGLEAHDVWFDPLKFPLVEGDEWQTSFVAGSLTARVMEAEGLNATIEMTGNRHVVLEYDASMRGIRKMTIDNYATWEVLEHGYDWHLAYPEYDGLVTVPHMSDLILCHGRLVLVLEVAGCALGTADIPTEEIEIDSNYDRVSFSNILLAGPAGVPATTPYTIRTTAADGSLYEDTLSALDGVNAKMISYKHDAPGGTWSVEAIAPGPGQAFSEGIGYHVYDVEIATGRILPSIGEHKHGTGEGH